jgi:hypothetical protein
MSETDQFWQYAREAMLSACDAKTGEDKQDLLEVTTKRIRATRCATPRKEPQQ